MKEETWVPRENLPRQEWNRQTKLTYNHWLAALVKWKCSSTKPTQLATGVVYHPDTEQNKPYKIPWPCWKLNRGPTAPNWPYPLYYFRSKMKKVSTPDQSHNSISWDGQILVFPSIRTACLPSSSESARWLMPRVTKATLSSTAGKPRGLL